MIIRLDAAATVRRMKDCFARLFVLLVGFVVLCCNAQDAEDNNNNNNNNNIDQGASQQDAGLAWMAAFSGLGPFLVGIFFVTFSLHVILYPQYATKELMKKYKAKNFCVPGQVLSCESKPNSNNDGETYLVEIMYQADEHRFADNPSMKFRFPDAIDHKKFLRRFDYHRPLDRGENVDILLSDNNWPRTGHPQELVERVLEGYGDYKYTNIIFGVGVLLNLVLLSCCIIEILKMENTASGWMALLVGLVVIEAGSLLYSADQFLKRKRDRYDAARPMVTTEEQAEARANRPPPSLEPNWKGFHNFAGHARADQ